MFATRCLSCLSRFLSHLEPQLQSPHQAVPADGATRMRSLRWPSPFGIWARLPLVAKDSAIAASHCRHRPPFLEQRRHGKHCSGSARACVQGGWMARPQRRSTAQPPRGRTRTWRQPPFFRLRYGQGQGAKRPRYAERGRAKGRRHQKTRCRCCTQ